MGPRRRKKLRGKGDGSGAGKAKSSNSLPTKLQLSLLNTRLVVLAEQHKAIEAIPQKPVESSNFLKLVRQRRKYPALLKLEWQLLTKVESHSVRHATKPSNEHKNQNKRIVPFDYNRVVLASIPGQPDSDYVNASFIDSILKPNAYIASQGPNEKTIGDFWRMVWQQNIYCIIMLTKSFDFIKVMCNQYWPAQVNYPETYGNCTVVVTSEEYLANFVIRNLKISQEGDDSGERSVIHFHYTEWPCHSVPFASGLLEFRRRVRMYTNKIGSEDPILVHCSDGGGRTGVFLAIDANLQLVEEDNVFDVFGYVKKLRSSRRGLVESLEQYRFIYEALEECIQCGQSWFSVSELSLKLKHKSTKRGIRRINEYQKEYEQICKMTPKFTIGDCAGGHRGENRDKNRDVIVVPPDNYRPYLTSFQGNDCTDYINAVFVDGYTKIREYIITEWPLKHTSADFWSLVYDHECNSIVVLCSPDPSLDFPSFWPETSRSRKYGNVFTVEHVSNHHYPNIKTWIFKISKKVVSLTELMAGVKAETKTTQLFQITCWPMGYKVPASTNALVELMNMVDRWRQRTIEGPVVVVSNNGCARAGVYCAASAAIEQVIQHQEVDVFQAVKTVRRQRPQLVDSMTEYKYCYDLVLHYVLHYLNKK
ncbi:hypothetical protein CHUAL_010924 [Chamberlinius hualienensis]